jgi:P27 family predicted phage terminase small subunit
MRGRKPKPTKLKILEGNPGRRPLPKNEPKPTGMPTMPHWLRNEAKNEWKRIVPELQAIGLLTKVDKTALAGYCQSYAKWKQAEEFIEQHGFTYQFPKRDETGKITSMYIAPYPQVSIARACLDQVKAFCAEFGMTPSSRTRLSVKKDDKNEDPMESLLSGARNN